MSSEELVSVNIGLNICQFLNGRAEAAPVAICNTFVVDVERISVRLKLVTSMPNA